MALSRNYLKGMGLTDEQVDAVIEAHSETVEALKKDRDTYKTDASKLKDVQKELDELKESAGTENEWKDKYDAKQKEFDDFKKDLESEKTKELKVAEYKALLKEANVSDKLIELVVKANATDIEALELDDNSKIKDIDKVKESITEKYADYITDSDTEGAGTETPPGTNGGNNQDDLGKLSMADYIKARNKK